MITVNFTSWGYRNVPPPRATRLRVTFSPFHSNPPVTRIEGQLNYAVPPGYNVVLLFGCELDKVECNVFDKTGRRVCRRIVQCVNLDDDDPYGMADYSSYDDDNWVSPRYGVPCTTQVPVPSNYL